MHIEEIFKLVKEYADLVDLTIKTNKFAVAFRGDDSFILVVNGIPFECLSSTECYRYLGVHINLCLDWKEQCRISEHMFKNSVEIILNKFYVPCALQIKLSNATVITALAYRMQFILFDET